MSDLVLNQQEAEDDLHEARGRGFSMGLPSHTHKSTGKGRFAHRKHQKSKSLCTLETNLDDVGEEGEDGAAMRRVPSVHELRVTKSLQKLNVPDWFKQSSLSKSSSCLLKYGSNSTMNSFSFSPSLISSPCASTAPPAPNVVIKTRVVPPSNPRILRSPGYSLPPVDRKVPPTPIKLPSEKLREKEKNKNLMPIPIVPFAEIRAMFEKKGKGHRAKKAQEEEAAKEENRETKPKTTTMPVAVTSAPTSAKPPASAVPSISISSEEDIRREESKPASAKRSLFDKPPVHPSRTSSPPPVVDTFKATASSPTSAQPQSIPPRPGHGATNGISDSVDGNFVSAPRTEEVFPPSAGSGRSPVTEKPPISPSSSFSVEPKDSSKKQASKDSQKDAQQSKSPPKTPPKEPKQQFSPSRSLRQFFGRSKDRSSEKKSEGGSGGGGGSSLDSSFSSGDGVYEKEPRRLGGSESSRRYDAKPATTTSFDRGSGKDARSDLDSSYSSAEGGPSGADTSRSLEGPSSRISGDPPPTSFYSFPASGSSRPVAASSNSDRHHQHPSSGPEDDQPPASSSSSRFGNLDIREAPKFQRRLPGAGTSFGRVSSSASSENGDYMSGSAVPASSSGVTESGSSPPTSPGEKKSVKETTV